jgi:2-desacetyl-2-hydroxyethyl bacteriochlorophyllide A dehydrogenase
VKAICLQEPGIFTGIELPETVPGELGADEALVRIRHVGLCGTDIHAYHGRQPFFEYPRILGHELGVEVLAIGDKVTHVRPGANCAVEAYLSEPGDRAFERGRTNCSASTKCLGVHVDGGMREQMVLPANKLIPSVLPTRTLALVEPLCIGHHAVERAALCGDETVAVIGMGPIGLGVVLFARLSGADVVALDISEQRLETARKLFPGIATLKVEAELSIAELWNQTGREIPEVVWDCTGNKTSMEAAISLPANGGKIVLVGIHKGDLTFSGPDFHRRELSILSTRNATLGNFRSVIHLLESGLVNADAWITHECTADEFPGKVNSWLAQDSGLLKGVIAFNQ